MDQQEMSDQKEPIKVCVTGAAGQIAYSLLHPIAKGDVFGPDQPIILTLLDIGPMMSVLEGVVMEMHDCAHPLLTETWIRPNDTASQLSDVTPNGYILHQTPRKTGQGGSVGLFVRKLIAIIATSEAEVAFKDIDVAILVGAMPRREGMERKDLLKANVKIFKAQGDALNKKAKKSVKVLVVGNPANTNCFICKKYAPDIPSQNFSCLTRLDQNRAHAQVSQRLGVSADTVKNAIIWGNHSSTQFPDCRHAYVTKNGQKTKVTDALKDDAWLKTDFVKTVQTRGAAVIKARKLSSAMSAAKAICDHIRDWWFGTEEGTFVSMGVVSDGSYGIAKDLVYSFPVTIDKNKNWAIVQGLEIDDFARDKMDVTMKELLEEKAGAEESCE